MKILIVTEFFPQGKDLKFSGGVEARNFFVAKELAKKNKVTIVASKTGKTSSEKINNINVIYVGPTRNYSASSGNILERLFFIKNAITQGQKLDVDLVEGTNFISHFIAIFISKKKRIPRIAWYPDVWVGSWISNAGILGIFGEILERINLMYDFDKYIAISQETSKKLKKHTKKRVHVIPCGVDQKEFKGKTHKFKNPTIITVSRLTKYKNIKTLVLAFSYLKTKIPSAELIIVGSGPEKQNLKSLAKALKIEKSTKFYSGLPRKKLIGLVRSSDLFSLPSIVEGFGIAIIEAAAASIPYVNSNIPTIKEVTKNGKGGFLVNPDKPFDFSKKIEELLTKKSLYAKKSNEAYMLSKNYNWKKVSEETDKVYKSLL